MAYPLDRFISYLVPFNFDDIIRVRLERQGEIIEKEIELNGFRTYAATPDENNNGNYTVKYNDMQGNKYTANELVKGYVCHLTEITIPHSVNGFICYCKKCNDQRAFDDAQLKKLPF